jgi:hypothetical protein
MFPALALALIPSTYAAAEIEFKSSSPVSIYVDGQQTSQPNPLKHKATGLDAGVHQLKVVGMFGKTLYEAEIDLPDNTITYAAWERGEIKVVSTDWLPKSEDVAVAAAAVEDDTGVDEQEELEVVEVTEPEPVEAAEAEVPAPAEAPAQDAVASVDPAASGAGNGGGAATTAAVAAGGVAAGMALEDANDPEPLATDSALTTAPAAGATATTTTAAPIARTLKLQAAEGMRIEITHAGQAITVVVKGGEFVIEDGSGFAMTLSGSPSASGAAATTAP